MFSQCTSTISSGTRPGFTYMQVCWRLALITCCAGVTSCSADGWHDVPVQISLSLVLPGSCLQFFFISHSSRVCCCFLCPLLNLLRCVVHTLTLHLCLPALGQTVPAAKSPPGKDTHCGCVPLCFVCGTGRKQHKTNMQFLNKSPYSSISRHRISVRFIS